MAWRSAGSSWRRFTVNVAAGIAPAAMRCSISTATPPALTDGAWRGSPSTHSCPPAQPATAVRTVCRSRVEVWDTSSSTTTVPPAGGPARGRDGAGRSSMPPARCRPVRRRLWRSWPRRSRGGRRRRRRARRRRSSLSCRNRLVRAQPVRQRRDRTARRQHVVDQRRAGRRTPRRRRSWRGRSGRRAGRRADQPDRGWRLRGHGGRPSTSERAPSPTRCGPARAAPRARTPRIRSLCPGFRRS